MPPGAARAPEPPSLRLCQCVIFHEVWELERVSNSKSDRQDNLCTLPCSDHLVLYSFNTKNLQKKSNVSWLPQHTACKWGIAHTHEWCTRDGTTKEWAKHANDHNRWKKLLDQYPTRSRRNHGVKPGFHVKIKLFWRILVIYFNMELLLQWNKIILENAGSYWVRSVAQAPTGASVFRLLPAAPDYSRQMLWLAATTTSWIFMIKLFYFISDMILC